MLNIPESELYKSETMGFRKSGLKGQNALEYLMTYGWAILIVIIVVGALYALGLTQPCKWVGTQVREFADFKVENPQYVASTDTLSFDVSRLKPDSVTLRSINVTGDAPGNSGTLSAPLNTTATRYTVTGLGGNKNAGDCYTVEVRLNYDVTTAGGSTAFSTTGKISGIAG